MWLLFSELVVGEERHMAHRMKQVSPGAKRNTGISKLHTSTLQWPPDSPLTPLSILLAFRAWSKNNKFGRSETGSCMV